MARPAGTSLTQCQYNRQPNYDTVALYQENYESVVPVIKKIKIWNVSSGKSYKLEVYSLYMKVLMELFKHKNENIILQALLILFSNAKFTKRPLLSISRHYIKVHRRIAAYVYNL